MLIYTGDTHGDFFKLDFLADGGEWTKDDYVIICGDFGGVWDGTEAEKKVLKELDDLPFTVLFVSGNHENYDLLETYPITEWHGGKVQFISDSVIHLMRSQVYEICGRKIFTFGGASSHDIDDGILEPDDPDFYGKRKRLDAMRAMYRINHFSWWKQELPSQEEMEEGIRNLEKHNWKVDHIVTHCAPTSLIYAMTSIAEPDLLTDYLEEIKRKCEFKSWFFGHYHRDRDVWGKFTVLYDEFCVFEQ